MSLHQAQTDALEHLVLALAANAKRNGRDLDGLFKDAHASIMGESNASGTDQKSAAAEYLAHLKLLVS